MKILVFDICTSVQGHRIPYAALVAKSFAGHDVTVALPKQMAGEQILKDLFSDQVDFQFFKIEEQNSGMSRIREAWRCLVDQIQLCQPDKVVIPTGDGMAFWGGIKNLTGLSATGKVPIDISLMRGHFRSPSDSWLKRTITNLKWWVVTKGPWQRILLIDPRSFDELKNPSQNKVSLCPDPAVPQKFFSQDESRQLLSLPKNGKIVVSIGNQEHRKGTDLLLKAFAKLSTQQETYLLLMGRFDDSTKAAVQESLAAGLSEDRLILRDDFVSDDQMQHAVIASDLVAAPYRDVERPSGIISRAVAWQRPLLVTNRGWLKWFVTKYQAGWMTEPENTRRFASDIESALQQCSRFEPSKLAEEFRTFNTEYEYCSIWNKAGN